MPLIPISNAGRNGWAERIDPSIRIVLDHWDDHAKLYVYHAFDDPSITGRISAGALEARYRPVGEPHVSPANRFARRQPRRPETTPLEYAVQGDRAAARL